jgi:hypothetical protein
MPSTADRQRAAVEMRVTARQLFEHALAEAGIDKAFERNVDCERGVLRICGISTISIPSASVSVISMAKLPTLLNSLEMQAGRR